MTKLELFDIVALIRFFGPLAVCLAVFLLARKPSRTWAKALLAIAAGWLFDFLFSVFVFKPVGFAFAQKTGIGSPEVLFGSNIGMTALSIGWMGPTVVVLLVLAGRALWQRVKKLAPKTGQELPPQQP